MAQAGGRPRHHEEIGKIRHGNAKISLRVVTIPNIRQIARRAANVQAAGHFGHFKTGRHNHNIGRAAMALIADHFVFSKARHPFIVQGNIVFADSVIPAIIQQNAFAIGRIVGHGFCNEVRSPLQFGFNMCNHFLAMAVINAVHGAFRVRPVGIFFQKRQQPVAITPKHGEAKPSGIKRHMLQQILRPV